MKIMIFEKNIQNLNHNPKPMFNGESSSDLSRRSRFPEETKHIRGHEIWLILRYTTYIHIYNHHYAVLGSGWGLRQSKWVVATLKMPEGLIERASWTTTSMCHPGIVSIQVLDWSQKMRMAPNRVSGNCGSTSSSALRSFRDDYRAHLR